MDFLRQPATFNIVPLSGVQDITWLAVASRNKQLCAFQIQLTHPKVLKDPKGHVPIAFSMGKFLRVDYAPDQDGSWFVSELMNELEVQEFPGDVERTDEIPFMAAIFGYNLHRYEDGGFTNKQAGHWMPMKLTTLEGADEVYLNLNQEGGLRICLERKLLWQNVHPRICQNCPPKMNPVVTYSPIALFPLQILRTVIPPKYAKRGERLCSPLL